MTSRLVTPLCSSERSALDSSAGREPVVSTTAEDVSGLGITMIRSWDARMAIF